MRDYIGELQAKQGGQNGASATPSNKYQTSSLNTILPLLFGGLGGVAGGVAGAGAGALIPGADLTGVPEAGLGYAGAISGAGAGAAAGNGAADMINSAMGMNVDPQSSLNNTIDNAKIGAGSEAVGIPAAKGLGYIAHPIQPFIEMVNKKLASSPETVDFSALLQKYKSDVLPELRKQGYGQTAVDAFHGLQSDIVDAVDAFRNHIPGDVTTPTNVDVNSMELPISQANQLKRNITSNLSKYYGGDTGQIDIEARKKFGNVLKDQIAGQEPGVKMPNAVASSLYKIPEVAGGLGQLLSLGNPVAGAAVRTVERLPFAALQKAIPAGGGYLNQAIPRFLQLLGASGKQ